LEAPASDPVLGPRRYTLERCLRCGSAVTQGEAEPWLYETGAYRPGRPRLHVLARPLLRVFDARRLSLLASLRPPPARLLDVGAGRGRFLVSARAAGYEASGLEPSPRRAAAAAGLGLPVVRAPVEDAPFAEGSFDAVSVWHVLEHLDDPEEALRRVARWLVAGGALLVGVPNLASLQARLGGPRWFHLDVPRHRVHFTERGLGCLLDRAGFDPVTSHHVLLEHNTFGMWQSLVSHLTAQPSYLYHLLKRNASARSPDLAVTVAALPLVPAAALLELAAGAAGRGGTVAMLARRRD
jgi:SAM-dependent methyltransferase